MGTVRLRSASRSGVPASLRLGVRTAGAARTRWLVALLGIVLVGFVDWVTGTELRVFPLYFLPISLGAWTSRRRGALGLAALATVAWMSSNVLDGHAPVFVLGFNSVAQAVAFVLVAYLIAELRRRLQNEQDLSRHDPLTGLLNRRAFEERVETVLAIARRHPRSLALAYLDLDNFKTVNDTRGHDAGDEVLRAVAEVLRHRLRSSDVVARLGGDEFAILLPETDAPQAQALLERVGGALEEAMSRGGWPVSASVGVICLSSAPKSLEEILEWADGLMYAAKRAGKGRIHVEIARDAASVDPAARTSA